MKHLFARLWNDPMEERFAQPWPIEEASTLATISICSVMTLLLYLSTFALWPGTHSDKWSFRTNREAAQPLPDTTPPFQMSGLQMGMTPIEVGSVHPSIVMSGPASSKQIGRFKIGNGHYSIFFKGPEAGRKSYQVHYTETFWDFSEIEIRERLAKKFGTPDINQCGMKNISTGWVCRFRWQRVDGIVLSAVTRSPHTPTGAQSTELEFTALDPKTRAYRKNSIRSRMQAISSAARGL